MYSDEESLYDPAMEEARGDTTPIMLASDRTVTPPQHVIEDNQPQSSTSAETSRPAQKSCFILEPPTFLVFLSIYLSGTVYQNLVLYQTCTAVYNYSETVCEPLLGVSTATKESELIETEVQPYVGRILMINSLIGGLVPAFLGLFIGPWSDKFGRRPILLISFTGSIIAYIINFILALFSTKYMINPWVYIISSVPLTLSGGICAMLIVFSCYISDVTPTEFKAKRLFLNDAAMGIGILVGSMTSSYLYAATNAATVFSVSAALMISALAYIYFRVNESLEVEHLKTLTKIREFFRFDLVKDLVRTCTAKRRHYDRAIIWVSMIPLIISFFVLNGEGNIFYLFLRKEFGVTLREFSIYNSISIMIKTLGCVFSLFLLRKVNLSMATIAMVGVGCSVLESSVRATAKYWWEMYLATALGSMSGIVGPMVQAILAVMVPSKEIGKIFALTTALQTLTPLGAAPLYTNVYNATLEFYAGFFNIISVSLYLLSFTLMAIIFGIEKSSKKGENTTTANQAIER